MMGAGYFPPNFPLGLSGIYGWNMQPQPTWKDVEDKVSAIIQGNDDGTLALLYKTLYNAGYRVNTCDGQIRKAKDALKTP